MRRLGPVPVFTQAQVEKWISRRLRETRPSERLRTEPLDTFIAEQLRPGGAWPYAAALDRTLSTDAARADVGAFLEAFVLSDRYPNDCAAEFVALFPKLFAAHVWTLCTKVLARGAGAVAEAFTRVRGFLACLRESVARQRAQPPAVQDRILWTRSLSAFFAKHRIFTENEIAAIPPLFVAAAPHLRRLGLDASASRSNASDTPSLRSCAEQFLRLAAKHGAPEFAEDVAACGVLEPAALEAFRGRLGHICADCPGGADTVCNAMSWTDCPARCARR